jgi:hypothetical protein
MSASSVPDSTDLCASTRTDAPSLPSLPSTQGDMLEKQLKPSPSHFRTPGNPCPASSKSLPAAPDFQQSGSATEVHNGCDSTSSDPSLSTSKSEPDEDGRILKKAHHHTNAHTECGRHSNDWLFGGISVTQTVKGMIWHKKR